MLIPVTCLFCGLKTREAYHLCYPCRRDLPILTQVCDKCAHFIPPLSGNANVCGKCLRQPPLHAHTFALFAYQSPVVEMIARLKFQHQLVYARALGTLFGLQAKQVWYKNLPLPDRLIPIPLHKARLKERGFNQTLEIGRYIARLLAIPIDIYSLERHKPTLAQSTLAKQLRRDNVSNAFHCQEDYRGATIALLDDVITTGHTATEACRILKQQGAGTIHLWCVARAIATKANNRYIKRP